jgi:hypothetical protein
MKRTSGRNIFITKLAKVLGKSKPSEFAKKCADARMSAIWIRVGRGDSADPNLSLSSLPQLKKELKQAGVELWGWHVPFCADAKAAAAESQKVLSWVDQSAIDGIVIDAERTNEHPRFRGQEAEAELYTASLVDGLRTRGCGVAFSSHDQPALHQDLPFKTFLKHVEDMCPQVYYTSKTPGTRLAKSVHDYKALVPAGEFVSRYKPTGNITIGDDIPLPDVETCLIATSAFIDLVKHAGYQSYSFWCADTAPDEIWALFNNTPV